MTMTVEHGFHLFSDNEISVGVAYARKRDGVVLYHGRLEEIANDAGKTRLNASGKLTPRQAASRAIRSFERRYPAVKISPRTFEAYVHAVAKMMADRSCDRRRATGQVPVTMRPNGQLTWQL